MTNLVSRCPHCGATADAGVVHVEIGKDAFGQQTGAFVLCDFRIGGCGASGGMREDEVDAIAMWERRAAEPPAKRCCCGTHEWEPDTAQIEDSRGVLHYADRPCHHK